jgi:predicted Rossmann fold flavoprotein
MIKKINDKFIVYSKDANGKKYDKVLLCNGSNAASKLGGSNKGYEIAESFGHKVEGTYPSLVQLEVKSRSCSKLAGVKVEAIVTLKSKDESQKQIKGDVLFTKYGISGFAILDMSPYISKLLLTNQKVYISLNLLSKYDRNELFSMFTRIKNNHSNYDILTMLNGLISLKVAKVLLNELNISQDTRLEMINIKNIKMIINKILNWQFEVEDTHGFEYAEVSGGGISVAEINSKTMESKLIKNLYFAGEVLDVTGQRGGYNLAFAWASGYVAGKNLGNKN